MGGGVPGGMSSEQNNLGQSERGTFGDSHMQRSHALGPPNCGMPMEAPSVPVKCRFLGPLCIALGVAVLKSVPIAQENYTESVSLWPLPGATLVPNL